MEFRRALAAGTAAVLVTGLPVAGCSTLGGRTSAQPSTFRSQVAASINGSAFAVDWQVDIIQKDGILCTQSVIRSIPRSYDCPPHTNNDPPLNFSIDGTDDRIDLIFGTTADRVTSLQATTTDDQVLHPKLKSVDRVKFFAYAVKKGTALDLSAKDSRGTEIASGHEKLTASG
ncbi:hypothetical protein [Actinomadura meridiana]